MPGRLGFLGILVPGLLVAGSIPAGVSLAAVVGRAVGTAPVAGVSIDEGQYATHQTAVKLDLSWPAGATSALVSNDPSFDAAGSTESVSPTPTVYWHLAPPPAPPGGVKAGEHGGTAESTAQSTAPVAPSSVYVRFTGSGISPATVVGHIVLDEQPPQISDAALLASPAAVARQAARSSAARAKAATARLAKKGPSRALDRAQVRAAKATARARSLARGAARYRIRVVAADATSGIAAVQTSPAKRGGVTTKLRSTAKKGFVELDNVVSPVSSSPPRYARVESSAGVWSSWIPITPALSVKAKVHGGALVVGPAQTAFTMNGFDYQPVTQVRVGNRLQYVNRTFAPHYYSPAKVGTALAQMERLGYNGVRIFVNPNRSGNPSGQGLDAEYVANLANFIRVADQDGIRVLLVTGQPPLAGGYAPAKDNPNFGIWNKYFLDPNYLRAEQRYLSDLVTGLRASGAPLSNVLWELIGEQDFDNAAAPLSWRHGKVRTANHGVYNMASKASRSAMESANLLHFTNTLAGELHRLVPGSLVGMGFYPPSINAKRRTWTVNSQVLFSKSARNDYVDVHAYSNLGTMVEELTSFQASKTTKALILGEFGAARSSFRTAKAAAAGAVQLERESCRIDALNLSGWLLWTWNTSAQREYWNALADHAVIARTLSPHVRPNPCR